MQSQQLRGLIAIAAADQSATSTGAFVPVERELVFDIDLTDYDDVRSCGKEGHICTKCWPLMAAAVQAWPSRDLPHVRTTWNFGGGKAGCILPSRYA